MAQKRARLIILTSYLTLRISRRFFNSEVESVKKEGEIFKVTTSKAVYEAKNVMVSIGKMGRPNKPDYKIPPSLNSVVNFNLDNCTNGEKVLVVGGGNSAVEYAIELCQYNKNYDRLQKR